MQQQIRHIMVTGLPGIGKSTLIRRVVDSLRAGLSSPKLQGFYTQEVRSPQGDRIGFDIVSLAGHSGPLARVGKPKQGEPTVGKYVVNVPSLEAIALPALAVSPHTSLCVVDEIGKMELKSTLFFPSVQHLLDTTETIVLGSLPLLSRGIPQVEAIKSRPDVYVVEVTAANRDALAEKLARWLRPYA